MSVDLFKNRYRIPSARAVWHDYKGGEYFVTICTKGREHYFGEISNGEMHLSKIGEYLTEQIVKTPSLRPDMNLAIPLFVVMPNHVHLIIIIGDNQYNALNCRDAMHCVSTETDDYQKNRFAPQSKNLASIVRGIKSVVTQFTRQNQIIFAWQPRFHDHIIRNQDEMNGIADYIENNVARWESDMFYTID